MVLIKALILLVSIVFFHSCNSGKSEEEMDELWSKAQTTGQIIERSGTSFNSGINKELAMRDASTRLQSGGGLLGNKGISVDGILGREKKENNSVGTIGIPINIFLWRGALDTVSFMPLNSADPMGGTIITDWYSGENNSNERCKLNIFITGNELKTQNLKVTSFCQIYENLKWVDTKTDIENNIKIENAILNKAKKLKLQSS
tara:strand:+ start:452 stop:1060 length:609 start_codon:yes stop_codon:yes gene_type:complete